MNIDSFVSVIIPMFNSEITIVNSINSVFSQTYSGEIEIVIVDDGSTDNSLKIVREYKNVLREISIKIIEKINGGVSSARNLGIQNSQGVYIAFLDSDDVWLPQKLEMQVEFFKKNPKYAFIGCLHNNLLLNYPYVLNFNIFVISISKLLIKMAPQTSTALLKKEIFDKVGMYDENQKYAEDGNLWLRICADYPMAILNVNLVIAGSGKPGFGYSGLSSKIWEMQKGEIKNIKEIFSLEKITFAGYLFYSTYSFIKYFRRILIVFLRKL